MKRLCVTAIIIISAFLSAFPGHAQEDKVFLREEFNDLKDWRPLYFRKIKRHTEYSVVREGKESYLRADSNASASGILGVAGFVGSRRISGSTMKKGSDIPNLRLFA